MAEYKTDKQVNYGFGLSFEVTGKAPVVAKRIWETLADAQAYVDSATDTAIAGLQLTVINDTDASKNGVYFVKEAAGENGKTEGVLVKLAQDADTSGLQSQVTANKQAIDKLNGDEGATGSVKTIAKSYADNALAAVPVKGIGDDNILSLSVDKKISATVGLSYSQTTKKIILTGKDNYELATIDASSFVKDGMLEGSALYKATAATGTVTINGHQYNLSGLTANHTYIVLVWNTDSNKEAMSIDVTTLIDVYTAGDGLTLTGNQFSVDKTKVAQKADLDKLKAALVDSASINGNNIASEDQDGNITGNAITLGAGDISLPNNYSAYLAIEDVAREDSVNEAIAKLEGKANKALRDAAAGVTSVGGQKGDIKVGSTTSNDVTIGLTVGTDKTLKPTITGLGTAAKHAEGDFATKEQGDKADNSVQYNAQGDAEVKEGTADGGGNLIVPQKVISKTGVLQLGADAQTSYDITMESTVAGEDGDVPAIKFSEGSNDVILTGVATPSDMHDAANKVYVDTKVSAAVSAAMTWATFE